MSPAQYFEPKLGQSLLYPGQPAYLRGQCVQSVMLWLRDTGTTPPVYPSAYMYYDRGIPGYTKIPAGAPIKAGDIVVWKASFPPSSGNGHIDVASNDGSLGSFSAYDQNWNPLVVAHILHTGNYNNYIAGYLRKEGNMSISITQVDHVLKMGLHREPTAGELGNTNYQSNPGLLIDTVWNNGGQTLYENRNPSQQQVLDHFHAYDVLGKHPSGEPTQEQLDYYSNNEWKVLYLDLLNYNHDKRKELEASSTAKFTPYTGSQLYVKQ